MAGAEGLVQYIFQSAYLLPTSLFCFPLEAAAVAHAQERVRALFPAVSIPPWAAPAGAVVLVDSFVAGGSVKEAARAAARAAASAVAEAFDFGAREVAASARFAVVLFPVADLYSCRGLRSAPRVVAD
jgi:hypothetical protein